MAESWVEWSAAGSAFVDAGFCRVDAAEREPLLYLRRRYTDAFRETVPGPAGLDDEAYLNRFHEFADLSQLNEARVRVIREHGGSDEVRRALFRCVAPVLRELVGPEIVMQRHVNLVVQPPKDEANLLYLHTDAWAGCSPYEVIAWVPLVDVFGTKSMYVVPRGRNQVHLESMHAGVELRTAEDLFARVEPDAEPVTMRFGEALLFSSTIFHGARTNETSETRFALNVRFKALFSPYGTKKLGETFMPVNYLPASEVGLAYEADFGAVRG